MGVIIFGVFKDRRHDRDSKTEQLQIQVDNFELKVDTNQSTGRTAGTTLPTTYTDNSLGIAFELPEQNSLQKALHLSYRDYLSHIGFAVSDEEWAQQELQSDVVPIQKMISKSDLLYFRHDSSIIVDLTDETTTPMIELLLQDLVASQKNQGEVLSEADLKKMRSQMALGESGPQKFLFENSFGVQIMDKSLLGDAGKIITLAQVFTSIQAVLKETIEELKANDQMILWVSTFRANGVLINDAKSDITIYRMNALFERQGKYYQMQIQWSPETKAPLKLWEQMKSMFETFRLV